MKLGRVVAAVAGAFEAVACAIYLGLDGRGLLLPALLGLPAGHVLFARFESWWRVARAALAGAS